LWWLIADDNSARSLYIQNKWVRSQSVMEGAMLHITRATTIKAEKANV
jgi:hypothetical protein